MAPISHKTIRARVRKFGGNRQGAMLAADELCALVESKELGYDDFSVKELARGLIAAGDEFVEACSPGKSGSSMMELMESNVEAVDSTAFVKITSQLIRTRVIEAYENPEFTLTRLVPDRQSNLKKEVIPGVQNIGDVAKEIGEGMPYPAAGFGEQYQETPVTKKRGFIVRLTREAVFFDQFNLIFDQAERVGEYLGVNKEKRIANLIIGATNNFSWNGTSYNTYQTSTPWINVKSSNELVDHTDVDASEQIFMAMSDPYTGDPINIRPTHMIVTPAYKNAALRILNGTEIRTLTNSTIETIQKGNSVGTDYTLVVSEYFKRAVVAAGGDTKWWIHCNPRKAFEYIRNWGIEVDRAPRNSENEFTQDIVAQFKTSERGQEAIKEPRATVKNYNS